MGTVPRVATVLSVHGHPVQLGSLRYQGRSEKFCDIQFIVQWYIVDGLIKEIFFLRRWFSVGESQHLSSGMVLEQGKENIIVAPS